MHIIMNNILYVSKNIRKHNINVIRKAIVYTMTPFIYVCKKCKN